MFPRRFAHLVDRRHIVIAALGALARAGSLSNDVAAGAIARYGIDVDSVPPWML